MNPKPEAPHLKQYKSGTSGRSTADLLLLLLLLLLSLLLVTIIVTIIIIIVIVVIDVTIIVIIILIIVVIIPLKSSGFAAESRPGSGSALRQAPCASLRALGL